MPDNVLAFLVALGVALLLTPAVIAFARRTGALDKPDARKVHVRPIPRIGGIGISAIARFLHEKGHKISGSDIKESKTTLELQNEGIEVITPHCKEAIKDQDFVVYSAAIK